MSNIALRPMIEADLPAIVDLVLATPLWQRHGVTRAKFTARLERGLAAEAAIWVTQTEAGRIAGFVWYVERGAFGRSGYVMLLGVGRAFQGQGIGRQLMAHAEAALFAQANDVFLLVSDFNVAAQRFYAALGYTKIGAIPDYVTPGVSELIYRKRKPDHNARTETL